MTGFTAKHILPQKRHAESLMLYFYFLCQLSSFITYCGHTVIFKLVDGKYEDYYNIWHWGIALSSVSCWETEKLT